MRKKWILFFIIYTVCMFLIFSYVLFPSHLLKRKIEGLMSRHLSCDVQVDQISFILPSGLRFKKITCTFVNMPEGEKPISMDIDQIDVAVDFLKVFTGRMGIKGKLQIKEGLIQVHIDQKWFGAAERHLSGLIKDISIQDFSFLGDQFDMQVTGLLNGELSADWTGNDIIKSNGAWSFKIDKGRIMPKQFPAFNYDHVLAEGTVAKQSLHINRIEIEGDDLSLVANGRVRLANRMKEFFIDTQVKLKILPRLKQRLGGFASFLPRPDKSGFINLYVSGPPGDLRFSSIRRK